MKSRTAFSTATLALVVAAATVTAAPAAAPGDVLPPTVSDVVVVDREGDSLRVVLTWGPAPNASFYRVRIGDNAGTWERSKLSQLLTDTLWAPMTAEPQTAFACVEGGNIHPRHGERFGEPRCAAWTVPADLPLPGQPGPVQVWPDTVPVTIASVIPQPDPVEAFGEYSWPVLGFGTASTLPDGVVLGCVELPTGEIGWIEATVEAGTRMVTLPTPRFWTEPGCEIRVDVPFGSDVESWALTVTRPYRGLTRLDVYPGATPVLLSDQAVEVYFGPRSVLPSSSGA